MTRQFTKAEVDAARGRIQISVCSQERYEDGPFEFGSSYEDGTLDLVIASLAAIRDSIPQEFRSKARCKISSIGSWEDTNYACIDVNFTRPETDEEVMARLDRQLTNAEENERRERATMAALLRKYPEQKA